MREVFRDILKITFSGPYASPALARMRPEPEAFAEHFRSDRAVVTFANLGGDALLVAPCPGPPGTEYSHLGGFVATQLSWRWAFLIVGSPSIFVAFLVVFRSGASFGLRPERCYADFQSMFAAEAELPADVRTAIEAHVAGCPRCVAFVESYRATPRILREATAATLPADLEASLLAAVRAARRAQ